MRYLNSQKNMESHLNSTDVVLLENFQYKLPSNASYVTDRKQSSYFASGSNIYSPTGTRVVKISINDASAWLDPESVLLQFVVENKSSVAALKLYPISATAFFRRVRIMAGNGVVLEDISEYNRVHHLFEIMKTNLERESADALGVGYHTDNWNFNGGKITSGDANLMAIPGAGHMVYSFKPLCGILKQDKMLPLKYLQGITFEFEIVSNLSDAVVSTTGLPDNTANDIFALDNTSDLWEIRDCQIKCQTCTLDNNLQNHYDKHMLDGKNIVVHYDQLITTSQSLGTANRDVSVNVTRACGRLKKLYVTQHKDASTFQYVTTSHKYMKPWNVFIHAMGVGYGGLYDGTKESEFEVQIGGKKFPERAQASTSEQFFHFKQCVGKSPSINKIEYIENKHVLAVDCQKVPALGAGINSKQGELMNIRLKYPSTVGDTSLPSELTVYLVAESLAEISDSGVLVLD